jgi:hypothetical protein
LYSSKTNFFGVGVGSGVVIEKVLFDPDSDSDADPDPMYWSEVQNQNVFLFAFHPLPG